MDDRSPSKIPFITAGTGQNDDAMEGPSSPFHAMLEEGETCTMMVKANPSDFSMPNVGDEDANDGILVARTGNVGTGIPSIDLQNSQESGDDDGDNNSTNSTYSTLKVHQGSADFDYGMHTVTQSKWEFGKTKRGIIKVFYMSVFAIVGAFLRMILAQLFGEECKNPGTVGWLKAGQPLCVTADGDTSISGGIIFADFPANLLGSFIMGLMQGTDTMDLPKILPIAWLNEDHWFQADHAIHLAIKTGFCGSLTTFSSWNSEMIMMLLGEDADRGSLVFRALFGYFIGVETCVASFILGKNIARYIFARVNPALNLEASETTRRKECGVYINSELADFERRFLSGFRMGEHDIKVNTDAVYHLEKWKLSTEVCRRNGHSLLPLLTDVEYNAMVLEEPLGRELIVSCLEAGWDVEALENWVQMKKRIELKGLKCSFISKHDFKFIPAALLFLIVYASLSFGLFYLRTEDNYTVTYRTMVYAGILAPFGALLRWKLSTFNGKIQRYHWFPVGTFAANVIGSIISASMVGLEPQFFSSYSFWTVGSVRAVKVGFSGCLSTVSTFVAETSGFFKSSNPLRGYLYVFISISTSALCAAVAYTVIDNQVDYY
mmetsp:Transcript_14509/g.17649  ORF Transcript_14509/g.17649 Transcript_14509/m.17649 type:complete len:605 (-) Transcript_14509:41-1855(-)